MSGPTQTINPPETRRVAVLTDSSCDLSPQQAREFGLHMLPLTLHFAGRNWLDHVELSSEELFAQLQESPTTPAPTLVIPQLEDFMSAVGQLLTTHDHVFSLHTSPLLGRVYSMAFHASQVMPDRWTVFNSNSTSGGLALQTLRAKRLFDTGLSVTEVMQNLRAVQQTQVTRISVTTLEGFRRAKLVGPVQALVGELRNIKPILGLQNGKLEVLTRVQGHEAAQEWMVQELKHLAGEKGSLQVNFGHNGDPDKLGPLRQAAQELGLPERENVQFGAVLSSVIGPDAVGFTVEPIGLPAKGSRKVQKV